MLGYSGVAQAGYMLAGVVVATRLGVDATVLYLGVYMFMNIAAFAVIMAAQRERADGDELSGLAGLGARNPWLAWPMSIAMLALAGIPAPSASSASSSSSTPWSTAATRGWRSCW